MKVVVVYQYYQGHDSPGHSVMYDMTQALAEMGHEVTVVSGESGYMVDGRAGRRWWRRFLRREIVGKVRVVRAYTYSELHRSYLGRLLSFISFSVMCPFAMLLAGKADIVVASSPPIFPVFSAWLTSWLRRTPFVLEVRDVWPASAVEMGILRNRLLIRVMEWMEHTLYRRADRIVALTSGIRDHVERLDLNETAVPLITCGVDEDRLYPAPDLGQKLRRQLNLDDKTVVLYFGALGEANNLPVILRAARSLSGDPDLHFLIVGNGMKRDLFETAIEQDGILNVTLLPAVAKEQANAYINAADICLVTLLDIPLFQGAIPTKLIDYMACGRPVLCGAGREAAQIAERSGAGLIFPADDHEALAGYVRELGADQHRRDRMGLAGREYVCHHFSAAKLRQAFAETLAEAVADRQRG